MNVIGINLISEDCILSASVYSEIFGWRIVHSGKLHSELDIGNGMRLYFSPTLGNCKVGVGSFTVRGVPTKNVSESPFFQFEQGFLV